MNLPAGLSKALSSGHVSAQHFPYENKLFQRLSQNNLQPFGQTLLAVKEQIKC